MYYLFLTLPPTSLHSHLKTECVCVCTAHVHSVCVCTAQVHCVCVLQKYIVFVCTAQVHCMCVYYKSTLCVCTAHVCCVCVCIAHIHWLYPIQYFSYQLQQSPGSDSDFLFSVSLALRVVPSTHQALTSLIPLFSDIYYSYALCEGDDSKQS